MEERLTIALPVYKRTDYIRKALDSAVNQTVKCKILLIDNNSPHDEFKSIIESYENPLMRYVRTSSTVPQDENFNNCFRFADTPWVTILHDDDLLHCQFVEMTASVLDKYKEKVGGIASSSYVSVDEWEGIHEKSALPSTFRIIREPFFYFEQLTPFPGVVLDREVSLEIGGFKSELHPIADFDFWYRYCSTVRMFYTDRKMSFYRISPTQSTNHLIDAMINNVYEYRQRLIRSGKYNNLMTRLALEQSRINNIQFFRKTYPNIPLPDDIVNKRSLERAGKLLRLPMLLRLVQRYRRKISFEPA